MDNFIFYVASPETLTFPFNRLSLQSRRNLLRDLLKQHAAKWETVRLRGVNFLASVQALGKLIEAVPDLADLTYESSPSNMLPVGSINEYDPMFGYFDPGDVQRFYSRFRNLTVSEIERFEASDNLGIHSMVLQAYRSSFAEAASRGAAVAIDHS